ncbi:MAG: hypothetical protein JWP69_165 [Flaviaesturariibacter sp.]|nr:hypothetical protein [Flaviaesturariibacter sp.]
MRKLFFLAIQIFFFSCSSSETNQQTTRTSQVSKFKNLLTKYKDISFDTLQVFSSGDLESNQYKFKGTQLDSADVLLFPNELAEQYVNDNGYFGTYKFAIDSTRIGLITRTPSTYEPSSIKLLILDKRKDAITDIVELAETFGDAGDMAEKISWLFQSEHKTYKSFTWIEESHDNSVDDENDTTIQTWNSYYLLDLSKAKIDTVSEDEKELVKRFRNLLKQ